MLAAVMYGVFTPAKPGCRGSKCCITSRAEADMAGLWHHRTGGVDILKWFSVLKAGRCVLLEDMMMVVLGGRCASRLGSDLIDISQLCQKLELDCRMSEDKLINY